MRRRWSSRRFRFNSLPPSLLFHLFERSLLCSPCPPNLAPVNGTTNQYIVSRVEEFLHFLMHALKFRSVFFFYLCIGLLSFYFRSTRLPVCSLLASSVYILDSATTGRHRAHTSYLRLSNYSMQTNTLNMYVRPIYYLPMDIVNMYFFVNSVLADGSRRILILCGPPWTIFNHRFPLCFAPSLRPSIGATLGSLLLELLFCPTVKYSSFAPRFLPILLHCRRNRRCSAF